MKSKAKPVKGSARTKRFDVGGTVGALAGLGTLAYLMSRKKKGAAGAEGPEFKPQGKFPEEKSEEKADSKVVKPPSGVIFEQDRARERALQQSKDPKSNLVPEGADRDTLYESDKALVRTDRKAPPAVNQGRKKKPAASTTTTTSAAKAKTGQGSSTITGVDAGIAAGNKKRQAGTSGDNNSRPSKPYPAAEAEANKVRNTPGVIVMKPSDKEISDIKEKQRRAKEVEDRNRKGQGLTPYASTGANKVRESERFHAQAASGRGIKNGGAVKKYASGGSVKASGMGSVKTAKPSMGSASKRADGIAQRGKTRGKVC